MLTRRRVLGAALLAAGCQPVGTVKLPLASLVIEIVPAQTEALMLQLQEFAQQEGFRFASKEPDITGFGWQFEFRRRDIWIEGSNPPKDTPANVPMGADGRPHVTEEIDFTRFDAGFFAGSKSPDAASLRDMVARFTEAVNEVDGAHVR